MSQTIFNVKKGDSCQDTCQDLIITRAGTIGRAGGEDFLREGKNDFNCLICGNEMKINWMKTREQEADFGLVFFAVF